MRPFHDARHTAIDAASGNAPMAVMKRAGHSDFETTQATSTSLGRCSGPEAERLETRLFGGQPVEKAVEKTAIVDDRENETR